MSVHVLILGGGIGGLEAAIFARKHGLEATLVSDRDSLWLYPTSIWIPTGETTADKVRIPLGQLAAAHGFRLVVDPVAAVRESGDRVELASGATLVRARDFDHLVVAFGGAKTQLPGQHQSTLSICAQPEQASSIAERLKALVAAGAGRVAIGFGGNPKDPSAVRGGPAFELMFNVDTWLRRLGLRTAFELTFFAPMPNPGARMGEKAAAAAQSMLRRQGVELRFGKKIKQFSDQEVHFEDGSTLGADLIVYLAAGAGHPALKESGLPLNDAGFVVTDGGCRVEGHRGVWAIGDAAALLGPDWRAKQGHIAEVMARTAIANIQAVEAGAPPTASYVEHVNILCVMDTGGGAALVKRDQKRGTLLWLPIIGHWLKKLWGAYYRLSKLRRIPRLPGL